MGNSASKTTRTLNKTIQQTHKSINKNNVNNLNKQINNDYLKPESDNKSRFTQYEMKENEKHQIFTERPPEELETMGDDSRNMLFEEAVSKGIVNIKDSQNSQNFNSNHESIQVLKNRQNIEKQYEGLFIPKDADKPNIPERFLSEEERKKMSNPEELKKKLQKTGTNAFGLFDSGEISDLIIDYKVYSESKFIEEAQKNDVNQENINALKKFIDLGIIDLPSHKVTLHESIDPESKHVKQKLVVVKDDWVNDFKKNLEKEKLDKINSKSKSKKDNEVFAQFKMLENLVSKSQISTKKSDDPNEESETVMKRPKKKIGKQITQML